MKKPVIILIKKDFITSKKAIIKKTIKIKEIKSNHKKIQKILKFKGVKLEFNNTMLNNKNIEISDKLNKLLKEINKYYNKEQRFNTYATLKKFITE